MGQTGRPWRLVVKGEKQVVERTYGMIKLSQNQKTRKGGRAEDREGRRREGKEKKKARKDEPAMLNVAHFIARKGYLN